MDEIRAEEVLLKPEGLQALRDAEPAAAQLVRLLLETCLRGIQLADSVDLAPYELGDEELADLSTWNALAPQARTLLVTMRGVIADLRAPFPGSEVPWDLPDSGDIELAFSTGPIPAKTRDDAVESVVDSSRSARSSQLGDSVMSLTAMLEQDVLQFGQLVRRPEVTADRWLLLGAFHELLMNCAQCLDAVAAVAVQHISSRPAEHLLTRYVDVTRRALMLRSDLRDLRFEVEDVQLRRKDASEGEEAAARRLLSLLDAFAGRMSYRLLRPLDKKALLECRARLRSRVQEPGVSPMRVAEDMLRFMEMMDGINRREHLMVSDRRNLEVSMALMDAEAPLDRILPRVRLLYGRWLGLDRMIRRWRRGEKPSHPELREQLDAATQSVT
ncbi:MAG: hypothetical protein ACFB9M_17475 [Myxococcota bacterium]